MKIEMYLEYQEMFALGLKYTKNKSYNPLHIMMKAKNSIYFRPTWFLFTWELF